MAKIDFSKFTPSAPSLTLEEARALQSELLKGVEVGEVSAKVNAAAQLLLRGKHDDSIAAYSSIAVEHPEERGTCEGQVGAAFFFKGEYETAIQWYEAARAHGADPSMMDDNIKEAKEAIEKKARGEAPSSESGGISIVTVLLVLAVIGGIAYVLLR